MLGTGEFGVGWKETLVTELALGSEDFVNRVRRLIKGDRNEQKAGAAAGESADKLAGHNGGGNKSLERTLGEG